MTLAVEDGSGVEDADAYISIDDFNTYCDARAFAVDERDAADEETIEASIRRATLYIDGKYRSSFPGSKVGGRSQSLEWPREDAEDAAGEEIGEDEVPVEVINATAEAAWRELLDPGSLTPDYVSSQHTQSETVGPISVTYVPQTGASDTRPIVQVIDEILAPLISGGGNFLLRC